MKKNGVIVLFLFMAAVLSADDYKLDIEADFKMESGNLADFSSDNPPDDISLSGDLEFSFEYKDFLIATLEYKDLETLEIGINAQIDSFTIIGFSNIEPDIFMNDILPYREKNFPDSITNDFFKDEYKEALETVNVRINRSDFLFPELISFLQMNVNEEDIIPNVTAGIIYPFSEDYNQLGVSYTSISSLDDEGDYDGISSLYYINHDNPFVFGMELVSGMMVENGDTMFWSSFNAEVGYRVLFDNDNIMTPAARVALHNDDLESGDDIQMESLLGGSIVYKKFIAIKAYGGSRFYFDNNTYSPVFSLEAKLSLKD